MNDDDKPLAEIVNLLKLLSAREEFVLKMRWGISGRCPNDERMTLAQIGAQFRLSKERIRQIEARGLLRLRYHSRKLTGAARELLQAMIDAPSRASGNRVAMVKGTLPPPERHSVLSVRCPICGSKPGRQCETRYKTGIGFVRWAHKERYARFFEREPDEQV